MGDLSKETRLSSQPEEAPLAQLNQYEHQNEHDNTGHKPWNEERRQDSHTHSPGSSLCAGEKGKQMQTVHTDDGPGTLSQQPSQGPTQGKDRGRSQGRSPKVQHIDTVSGVLPAPRSVNREVTASQRRTQTLSDHVVQVILTARR